MSHYSDQRTAPVVTSSGLFSSQNTLGTVANTPIEIWKNIIDDVLWGPVYFFHNPFYTECNPHTALRQWSDGRRMRKLEAQRGILRLVSHSWKLLADSYPKQYFEPFRSSDTAYQLSQSSGARRLQMSIFCSSCGCDWQCQCDICGLCFSHIMEDPGESFPFPRPVGSSMNVEILVVPDWELREGISLTSFPNLKALTVYGEYSQIVGFSTIFRNLVFLSLQVEARASKEYTNVKLPSLRTMQLQVLGIRGCVVMNTWNMPNIQHLDIQVENFCSQSMPSVIQLIRNHGKNLTILRLRLASSRIHLPDDFWDLVPCLKYLGTSIFRSNGLRRPGDDHPIDTLAVLQRRAPPIIRSRVISWIYNLGKELKTIADSHTWEDAPASFMEFAAPHPHVHEALQCWKCIGALYGVCKAKGMRYEDINGKVYNEVW